MHRILAIALCMLWSVAGLAADAAMPAQSCASLGEATAGPEDNFRPPLEGEVIDKGAPISTARRVLTVSPGSS